MKIRVNTEGSRIRLWLPNWLIMNRLTAQFGAKAIKGKGAAVTGRQINRLFKAIRAYRRAHPDWVLVEVQSCAGEDVYIKI